MLPTYVLHNIIYKNRIVQRLYKKISDQIKLLFKLKQINLFLNAIHTITWHDTATTNHERERSRPFCFAVNSPREYSPDSKEGRTLSLWPKTLRHARQATINLILFVITMNLKVCALWWCSIRAVYVTETAASYTDGISAITFIIIRRFTAFTQHSPESRFRCSIKMWRFLSVLMSFTYFEHNFTMNLTCWLLLWLMIFQLCFTRKVTSLYIFSDLNSWYLIVFLVYFVRLSLIYLFVCTYM